MLKVTRVCKPTITRRVCTLSRYNTTSTFRPRWFGFSPEEHPEFGPIHKQLAETHVTEFSDEIGLVGMTPKLHTRACFIKYVQDEMRELQELRQSHNSYATPLAKLQACDEWCHKYDRFRVAVGLLRNHEDPDVRASALFSRIMVLEDIQTEIFEEIHSLEGEFTEGTLEAALVEKTRNLLLGRQVMPEPCYPFYEDFMEAWDDMDAAAREDNTLGLPRVILIPNADAKNLPPEIQEEGIPLGDSVTRFTITAHNRAHFFYSENYNIRYISHDQGLQNTSNWSTQSIMKQRERTN
eukprot:TRINITY_DN1233_c0_g1_i2.p1 TRINITY_DN1233_c0_g1~~TRINITY_DN1233_c0_g1_i2.p1  ORF type:complete len:295 (-),score=21.48 TRINITY_DN1233_c0_g1_i2:115-999(-)